MNESTRELTAAIDSGDTEAFARFYEAWFDRVYVDARRVTGRDEAFCLDVVHDVMMRVIKSLKSIDEEAALTKWLRVTVRSCAIDRLRAERRRRDRESATSFTRVSEADHDGIDEQLTWLRGELARLDPDTAALLTMRHCFDWTLQRIGTALGVGTGAVDRRLRSTIERLRTRAGEVFDE